MAFGGDGTTSASFLARRWVSPSVGVVMFASLVVLFAFAFSFAIGFTIAFALAFACEGKPVEKPALLSLAPRGGFVANAFARLLLAGPEDSMAMHPLPIAR